jgi:glycosyltransferase involved in cell wall biosynthesis
MADKGEKGKILVLTSTVPPFRGGNEILAERLVEELRKRGYEAGVQFNLRRPSPAFACLASYLNYRYLTSFKKHKGKRVNKIISLAYPSYAAKHKNHVCWLNHGKRECYDQFDTIYSWEKRRWMKLLLRLERSAIHFVDKRIFRSNPPTIRPQSINIKKRLSAAGIRSGSVVYPPCRRDINIENPGYGDFIFLVSRFEWIKRIPLLIEAFRFVRDKKVKAVIVGGGPEYEKYMKLIKKHRLEKKVKVIDRFISDKELINYYKNCMAVFYGPQDEDYGMVTLEAMKSRKAVITCTDSGGPTEFVRDGKNGFIAKPYPREIARRIDRLAGNRGLARRMGQNAFESVEHINWDEAIEELLSSN